MHGTMNVKCHQVSKLRKVTGIMCVHIRVCVCVCVCERERERDSETENVKRKLTDIHLFNFPPTA